MPRFYFDCCGSRHYLLDGVGTEFASLAEARVHALRVARFVMRTGRSEEDWYEWIVEITDEGGDAALHVPFSDAAH